MIHIQNTEYTYIPNMQNIYYNHLIIHVTEHIVKVATKNYSGISLKI